MLGTVGQYKRMEAVSIRLKGMDGYASGNIRYQAHVQNIGWQGWKQNGSSAGTSGKALRLEAVQIQLDGEIAQIYDVYYRVHVQNYGWLGWAKNGAVSGTSGFGYRMEAVQIQLVPKGWKAPGSTAHPYMKKYTNNELTYSGHVQNVGNVAAVKGGTTLGTVGKGRRLEGFTIIWMIPQMDLRKEAYSTVPIYRISVGKTGNRKELLPEQPDRENGWRLSRSD